jgi:23S rRNA (uracil1939-C5)-methyltransferase
VAISCNPQTFVNDANTLIAGGYQIKEITMVDQFVYTRHCELVALFEI